MPKSPPDDQGQATWDCPRPRTTGPKMGTFPAARKSGTRIKHTCPHALTIPDDGPYNGPGRPSRRWDIRSTAIRSRPSTSSSRSWTAGGAAASSSSNAGTRRPAGRCREASSITARRSRRPPSAKPVKRPLSTSSSSGSWARIRIPPGTRASTRSRRSSWPGPPASPGAPTMPGGPPSSIPGTGACLWPSTIGRSSTTISDPGKGPCHAGP